jgi:hypothetical protein
MTRLLLSLALLCCWLPAASADVELPRLEMEGPASRVAGEGHLIIGGHAIRPTAADYHRYVKFLTVAPSRRKHPAFHGSNLRALQGLECPLRRQIFAAMYYNRSERFVFASLQKAMENFDMRMAAVSFMFNMEPSRAGGLDFDYAAGAVRQDADRGHWLRVSKFSFVTKKGMSAAESIDGIVHHRFRGECLGAMQLNVLHAARVALGPARFNALHPHGLDIGAKARSAHRHIRTAASLKARDMVPGDWVYMKNKDDYNSDLRPGTPVGYWQGENAMFLGRCELGPDRVPQFSPKGARRFSGMGAYGKSEAELRSVLKAAYLKEMRPPRTFHVHSIQDGDVRWFNVQRLETGF